MGARKAVTKELLRRYRRGSKGEKGRVLDELCGLTEWSRDHATRALRRAGDGPGPPRARPVRSLRYGADLQAPLERVWATYGGLCGKRLAPFMAEAVEAMERFEEIVLSPVQREQLLAMSAATIDRRLASARRRLGVRGRSGTKPGTLLKRQIPIRTFADWNEHRPGFLEIDLVAHDGGMASGDYCQSLDATDVATGWTEPAALKNKAQVWVFAELKRIRSDLPFPLLGLDSDNGSEFINHELLRYCGAEKITYLLEVTELELLERERRSAERRLKDARFPSLKFLESFDFTARPSVNKVLISELARCEFIDRRENVLFVGNPGTGKSHCETRSTVPTGTGARIGPAGRT